MNNTLKKRRNRPPPGKTTGATVSRPLHYLPPCGSVAPEKGVAITTDGDNTGRAQGMPHIKFYWSGLNAQEIITTSNNTMHFGR